VSRRKEREREGEEYLRWVMPLLRVSMSAIGLLPEGFLRGVDP
jgi:hypothetical protein